MLIDTHVLIWWWANDNKRLGRAERWLTAEGTEIFVSAASAWEIATKVRLGKLETRVSLDDFETLIARDGFVPLSIHTDHALAAGRYEMPHADPFDRMLSAQAELEGLTLLSRDPVFAAFPCTVLW